MQDLLDIAQVAAYLGVSERTVYDRVRSGELPAVKIGRLWRVRAGDLESWLAGSANGAAHRPTPRTGAEPAPDGAVLAREGDRIPSRADLMAALEGIDAVLERRLAFVAMLSAAVEALGRPAPVIVGGHAVEFYTAGDYATVDIDLVGASEPIGTVLDSWGFLREGRHWYDAGSGIVVEAPGSQLDPDVLRHVSRVRIGGGVALVLGIEDLIVDRLAACVHWSDEESCAWAGTLLRVADGIDMAYLRRRASTEQVTAALDSALAAIPLGGDS